MHKTGVLAIALAAVLLLAAVPFGVSVWADDEKSKARDKLAVKEVKQAKFDDDDDDKRANVSLGNVKATGKGVAVVKSPGNVKTSDAELDLSGTVFKDAGKNARVSVTGTMEYGGQEWDVRATGKVKAQSQSDIGKFQLHGKLSKDGERSQVFRLNVILLPTQDEDTWKFIGEAPVIVGRQVRIYALTGELNIDRTAQPAPQPVPTDLDRFVVSTIGSQVAGTEFTFKVTAIDKNGNVKTDYAGTVTLSTSAGTSASGHAPTIAQSSYTFTAADAGMHVFTAKMFKTESATITVVGSGKTATSNAFEVKHGAVSGASVSPASATVNAGASATFTASAKDAYGNSISGATFAWALQTPSLGTLAVSSDTSSAVFTGAAVSVTTSSALAVVATHGGSSVSSSAILIVSPA